MEHYDPRATPTDNKSNLKDDSTSEKKSKKKKQRRKKEKEKIGSRRNQINQ